MVTYEDLELGLHSWREPLAPWELVPRNAMLLWLQAPAKAHGARLAASPPGAASPRAV